MSIKTIEEAPFSFHKMVVPEQSSPLSHEESKVMAQSTVVLEEGLFLQEKGATFEDEEKAIDPYALTDDVEPSGTPWQEMSSLGKCGRVVINISKILLLTGLLYLFICSLSFLSSAFRLLGGKAAGKAFSSNKILSNPVAGLMIGVLATVLVQSSSTSTSIIVAMVAAKIISVQPAIPIIMGANIGTSVTNTLVSLAQVTERNQFRRAFAGAVVHDMFNILSVVVFLPIEAACGYLYHLTSYIVRKMSLHSGSKGAKKEMLKKITKPFTNMIIQLDKKIITKIARGEKSAQSESLIKHWCDKGVKKIIPNLVTKEVNVTELVNVTSFAYPANQFVNHTATINISVWENKTVIIHSKPCNFLLHDTGLSDSTIGAIMLVVSLVILCLCLVAIVKILHSMLSGKIALIVKKTINSDFPKPFGFLTGYFALFVGAGMTLLVQSSSIFTSTLTPLVGLGIVSLDRIFPLTLGANIGTTATGILAALASPGDRLGYALQIAFCHLFFNISGILLWYPVPSMRKVPINFAKKLGNTTAKYRWFAPLYIMFMFFIVPGSIFALSLAGWLYLAVIGGLICALLVFIIVVNILQSKYPKALPEKLRTWEWTPVWVRSLEPHDKVVTRVSHSLKKKCWRWTGRKETVSVHLNSDLQAQFIDNGKLEDNSKLTYV